MSRLDEIIDRLKEAREWADRCGYSDLSEGMYPQNKLTGDLDYLIATIRGLETGEHPDYPWKRALEMAEDARLDLAQKFLISQSALEAAKPILEFWMREGQHPQGLDMRDTRSALLVVQGALK